MNAYSGYTWTEQEAREKWEARQKYFKVLMAGNRIKAIRKVGERAKELSTSKGNIQKESV